MNPLEIQNLSIDSNSDNESENVNKTSEQFYSNAEQYWSEVPATVDGMLGGFGFISHLDIQGSKQFLKILSRLKKPPDLNCSLDCGAGIGRVTKFLLTEHFKKVDLVEQNSNFLEKAKSYLETKKHLVGEYYCCGLQHFVPEINKYDVIWCQWVLGHLTEDDLVKFLQSCKGGLRENGIIVIKENLSKEDVDLDKMDSSYTRSYKVYMEVFERAELRLMKQMPQTNFPKQLYAVNMFALRPQKINLIDVESQKTNGEEQNATNDQNTQSAKL